MILWLGSSTPSSNDKKGDIKLFWSELPLRRSVFNVIIFSHFGAPFYLSPERGGFGGFWGDQIFFRGNTGGITNWNTTEPQGDHVSVSVRQPKSSHPSHTALKFSVCIRNLTNIVHFVVFIVCYIFALGFIKWLLCFIIVIVSAWVWSHLAIPSRRNWGISFSWTSQT